MTSALAPTGSPAGEPVYLAIGYLRRPHGVRGEIILDLHTDFPERLKPGRRIYIGEGRTAAVLRGARPHGRRALVQIEGYDTPEGVGRLTNQWVYVRADEVPPLPQGKHYQFELLGVEVVTQSGESLGTLEEILETGANDVYVIRGGDRGEILIPAIPSVLTNLDLERNILTVRLLDGLIPD